jgi:hypothetical protein
VVRLRSTSNVVNTRTIRRDLTYELGRLRWLQNLIDETIDELDPELAIQIRDQAVICLELLDQYESSVPGQTWSYAARKCNPLREELKRTEMRCRTASGEWRRRPNLDT